MFLSDLALCVADSLSINLIKFKNGRRDCVPYTIAMVHPHGRIFSGDPIRKNTDNGEHPYNARMFSLV